MSDNLIETVLELMQSDDENTDKQSRILTSIYNCQDSLGQQTLDSAFIALCGYSLDTLINHREDVNVQT